MHQHQAAGGAGQAKLAEGERGRQQHGLERQEAAEQEQAEEQLRPPETPHRQHIAVERTEQGRDHHRRHGDLHRVPEVAADRVPGLDPADAGDHLGPAQQVAGTDVFRRLEAGQQHHDQRDQVQRTGQDQGRVDGQAAEAQRAGSEGPSHGVCSSVPNTGTAPGSTGSRRASGSRWPSPCPSAHG
ncbi:hypothetical protein D3C81_999680 [compost metagenome]